jgi:hypothetical protein
MLPDHSHALIDVVREGITQWLTTSPSQLVLCSLGARMVMGVAVAT